MNTLRKFITYYSPYKTVFFIDLLCAAFISIVDLAYPQILRVLTNTLFTKDSSLILHALPFIAAGLLFMYLIQSLCKYYVRYQGHMMRLHGTWYAPTTIWSLWKNFLFLITAKIIQDRWWANSSPICLTLPNCTSRTWEPFYFCRKIIGSFIFLFLINARLALPLAIIVFMYVRFFHTPKQKNARNIYG